MVLTMEGYRHLWVFIVCCIGLSQGKAPLKAKAIDCKNSKVLHTMEVKGLCKGNVNNSYVKMGPKEITVVQEDAIGVIKGFKCQKWESRFKYHCGMYSHLSLDGLHEIRRPVIVPEAQCIEVFMDHKLTIESGRILTLSGDGNLRFHYNYLNQGDLQHDTHSVSCQGTTAHLNNKEVYGEMEVVEVEFSIKVASFEVTPTQIKDLDTQEVLPGYCKEVSQCNLPNKELIYFDSKPSLCTLYQVRTLIAERIMVKVEGHQKLVYVNDEHKLIFVQGQQLDNRHRVCFRGNPSVFETQIQGVFVLENGHASKEHIPEITAERVNPQIQLIMVDDYFNFHLQAKLSDLVSRLNLDFCRLHQQTLNLVESSPFHKDAIIKVSGEIVQELQCYEREVFLSVEYEPKKCFSAIPIEYEGKIQFMKAGTRLIVERPEVHYIDCILAPKYIIEGKIVVANPGIKVIDTPLSTFKVINQVAWEGGEFSKYELSGESTFYTQEEMDEFIQLVHYQRGQETMKDILTSAYCETGTCGQYSQRATLKSGLDFRVLKQVKEELDSLNPVKMVWDVLKEYAVYWAIYLFLERIVSLVLRCYACVQFRSTNFDQHEAFRLSFLPGYELRKLMKESMRKNVQTEVELATMSQLETDIQNTSEMDERMVRRLKREQVREELQSSE